MVSLAASRFFLVGPLFALRFRSAASGGAAGGAQQQGRAAAAAGGGAENGHGLEGHEPRQGAVDLPRSPSALLSGRVPLLK